jgi:hypothetical protein
MNIQEACELVRADFFAHRWVLLKRGDRRNIYYSCYRLGDAATSVAKRLSPSDCAALFQELLESGVAADPEDLGSVLESLDPQSTWSQVIRELLAYTLHDSTYLADDIQPEETLRFSFDEIREAARFHYYRAIH